MKVNCQADCRAKEATTMFLRKSIPLNSSTISYLSTAQFARRICGATNLIAFDQSYAFDIF